MINPMKRNTRATPLRRSLNRVPSILGAERTPMILLILISTVLIFSIATLETTAIGLALLAGGIRGLQAAARTHPRASQVYREYVKLRRHYPARRRFPTPMPHRRVCKLGACEPNISLPADDGDRRAIAGVDDRHRSDLEPAR